MKQQKNCESWASLSSRHWAEKKENFLTLNRHTMEVPKKSNQSIIPAKKSEQLRKENYLQSRFALEVKKKGDFLHNWILFIFCFDLFLFFLSFVLRKRISFHGSLKRGIKKIKYLSFCAEISSMEQQQLNLTIFHFRLFMNSVARVQYRL